MYTIDIYTIKASQLGVLPEGYQTYDMHCATCTCGWARIGQSTSPVLSGTSDHLRYHINRGERCEFSPLSR